MVLTVSHLPDWLPNWLSYFRPYWISLVLFYWSYSNPDRMSLFWSWIMGVFVDSLTVDPVGLNGLCFATAVYTGWLFHETERRRTILHQFGMMFMLVVIVSAVKAMVGILVMNTYNEPYYLIGSSVGTILVWFPLAAILRNAAAKYAS